MKRVLVLVLALGFALASLIGAGAVYANESDHEDRTHRTVRITRHGLEPATLKLTPKDAVIFVNYSDELVQVAFEPEVAQSLVCEGPSNFTLTDKALYSAPLRGNEFASACRFQPGTYEYTVRIIEVPQRGGATEELKGKIVVEE